MSNGSSVVVPNDVVHTGGCHCRRVRWRAEAPASVAATICNCSDCSKFELQPGAEKFVTTYTFGTHTAKHTFCKVCGVTSFYTPRSDPDRVAVTVSCVDPGTLQHVEYTKVDGRNWEEWFQRRNRDNASLSSKGKPEAAAE